MKKRQIQGALEKWDTSTDREGIQESGPSNIFPSRQLLPKDHIATQSQPRHNRKSSLYKTLCAFVYVHILEKWKKLP